MAGWGGMPWGGGAFGAAAAALALADLSIVGASAQTTNSVRVTLTTPPLALSSSGLGDALNPATWAVSRLDTLASFVVTQVDRVTSVDFDVHVLQEFGSSIVAHRVSAPTLLREDRVAIVTPDFADFFGTLAAIVPRDPARGTVDLANPPAPKGINTIGGTLVMTPGGDYATVKGNELVKKLILRRLTTLVGEFYHLPKYGVGFSVKEPLPVSDLVKLKAEIERQARSEPEVVEALAQLTLSSDNILTVVVKARLQSGDRITASFKPTGSPVAF